MNKETLCKDTNYPKIILFESNKKFWSRRPALTLHPHQWCQFLYLLCPKMTFSPKESPKRSWQILVVCERVTTDHLLVINDSLPVFILNEAFWLDYSTLVTSVVWILLAMYKFTMKHSKHLQMGYLHHCLQLICMIVCSWNALSKGYEHNAPKHSNMGYQTSWTYS